MRILFSAYACEAGRGSEPGVGWNWAEAAAHLGHEVWVITRSEGRKANDAAIKEPCLSNLHFIYYDLPRQTEKFLNEYVHYNLWQLAAYFQARDLIRRVRVDAVHHVSWVSVRNPSLMGLLGIPFTFGPVGGGESTPRLLGKSFPLRGKLWERLRALANFAVRFDPLMHTTFATATRILVTSTDSLRCVPKRYRDKCDIQLGIGSDVTHSVDAPSGVSSIKLLFAGRLVYWKGVHLALSAFKQVLETIPDAQLTIVGSGPDECWLKDMATSLCVNHAVEWRPWVQRDELIGLYQGHTALLFPSLHDSGGMVVLEALSNGLPVVCLDLGGPGVMVDDSCGVKVDASCSQSIVVKELADAVLSIALNPKKRNELSSGSIARASTFEWTTVAEKLYGTSSASHSGTPLGQRPLTAVY